MEVGQLSYMHIYGGWLLYVCASTYTRFRKCRYMEANFCAYTKADFRKCAFMEADFRKFTFMEVASMYAHLWKSVL